MAGIDRPCAEGSVPLRVHAGIDIGGTTTQVVLCDPDGVVVERGHSATPARVGGTAMVETAAGIVHRLVSSTSSTLVAAGVGAAGVVERHNGTILEASDSFVDWAGYPLGEKLAEALSVGVVVENDVNAFLSGEVLCGGLREERNALGITLGTGVGGALWLNGALWSGPHDSAGEIGHIPGFGDEPCTCGGRGHLETIASGRGIERFYVGRTGVARSAREIAERVASDPDAHETYRRAARGLARGILITVGLVDVTTVVIGGGVSGAWDVLSPLLHEALAEEPSVNKAPIRVERSLLGGDAVAVGAAAIARSAPR